MRMDTKESSTHLISAGQVTKLGHFLRKTKLDELPQLFNVLAGHMSLVGPRPCLPSQLELIELRRKAKVFTQLPGITGLAQIRGVDMSDPQRLVDMEKLMIIEMSIAQYFRYILLTVLGKGFGDRVH